MKNLTSKIALFVLSSFIMSLVGLSPALAQPTGGLFENVKDLTNPNSLIQLAKNIMNLLISLAGGWAAIWLIIAGLRYVTSAGNPQLVEGAKRAFYAALIGIILIIGSIVIIVILNQLLIT